MNEWCCYLFIESNYPTKKDEFCWFIHNKTKWFSNWKNPYYLLNSMSSWLQWSLLKHTCLSVGGVLLHSKKDPITLASNLNFICLVFQWFYCSFFCIHIFLELNFHLKNDHDLKVEVQVIYKLSIELYITTIPQCWYHTKWEHFCSDSRRFRQNISQSLVFFFTRPSDADYFDLVWNGQPLYLSKSCHTPHITELLAKASKFDCLYK